MTEHSHDRIARKFSRRSISLARVNNHEQHGINLAICDGRTIRLAGRARPGPVRLYAADPGADRSKMVQRLRRRLSRRRQPRRLSRRRACWRGRSRAHGAVAWALRGDDGARHPLLLCHASAPGLVHLVLRLALSRGPHRRHHHGARRLRRPAAYLAGQARLRRRRDLCGRRPRRRRLGHAGAAAAATRLARKLVWPRRAVRSAHADQLDELADGRSAQRNRAARFAHHQSTTGVNRSSPGRCCSNTASTRCALVPHMVFLVDFVARGLGQGIAAGSHYWVLYGLGAIVGPLLTGHSPTEPGLGRPCAPPS